jgi:hypothetical protein
MVEQDTRERWVCRAHVEAGQHHTEANGQLASNARTRLYDTLTERNAQVPLCAPCTLHVHAAHMATCMCTLHTWQLAARSQRFRSLHALTSLLGSHLACGLSGIKCMPSLPFPRRSSPVARSGNGFGSSAESIAPIVAGWATMHVVVHGVAHLRTFREWTL